MTSQPDLTRTKTSLFNALLRAQRAFGAKRPALVDGDERALTYGEIVRAAFALGHALKKGTVPGEVVGIMLPTGIGSLIAFFALHAYGRIPAMLNFTAGISGVHVALHAAQIQRIVTARRFIDLGKLEHLDKELSRTKELIYLEDVRAKLSIFDKLAAVIGSLWPGLIAANPDPHAPAAILFTSGTEGEPKGVALSHANILANVEQVRAHLALSSETDIVFNPLPTFHCFGLTVGSLMPLYLGIKAILHPTPRQPHEIVRRVRDHKATILLATDTFVSQYARTGEPDDLASLRLAVCGAERVHEETRVLLARKYSVELLEGYGVTEASPVVSANQPGANHAGTVGRLVGAMEYKIEPVEGIQDGGRLHLRGPNIMLGYLKPDVPGKIVPPPGGWHDTGDVVAVDADGFLSIKGRLKRFAKIGGETVSLTTVENCASALWPDFGHAAVAVPDGRKGEQIVLVTTFSGAERSALLSYAQTHGIPELAVPRRIIAAEEIPLLGTGKTDYTSLQKFVSAKVLIDPQV